VVAVFIWVGFFNMTICAIGSYIAIGRELDAKKSQTEEGGPC
jgi:hypothetical protein